MKPHYTRNWTADELVGRDPNDVVTQSDKLTDAIRPILFNKHPGAQMLTLAELAAIWVAGHEGRELQANALETFQGAMNDFMRRIGEKGKGDGKTTESSN